VIEVGPIRAVGVVVPAHDEQQLLPACLSSLRVAARHPALRQVQVHLVPVLDACSDDSGAVAAGALEVQARNVGVARAAGFAEVLAREAGRAPGELWLATTDADSTVPTDWLAEQLRLAALGAEVVAGTVRVQDWTGQPAAVRRRFGRTYGSPGQGHPHVHGANLGMSAIAYLDAGGVPPLALAEDRALVDALRIRARRLVATGRIPVTTSGRRESRTVGGFADHLRGLAAG
jgi:glycosyltransferase involved in cell wall biosynthesis